MGCCKFENRPLFQKPKYSSGGLKISVEALKTIDKFLECFVINRKFQG